MFQKEQIKKILSGVVSVGRVIDPWHALKVILPEVGDLQRSSDVAEPSLMSHSPTDRSRDLIRKKRNCIFLKTDLLKYTPPFQIFLS